MSETCATAKGIEGGDDETAAMPDGAVPADDGEFKLTVRKLELPVRPRGVLAE